MTTDELRDGTPNSAYIGEGVTVKGSIVVPEEIVVDGVVEGDVTAHSIRIGTSGSIKGKVVSADLDVSGTLGKHTEVRTFLVIRSSARVEGHINCGDFEVERGAVLDGGIFSVYAAEDVSPVNDNERGADASDRRARAKLDAAE